MKKILVPLIVLILLALACGDDYGTAPSSGSVDPQPQFENTPKQEGGQQEKSAIDPGPQMEAAPKWFVRGDSDESDKATVILQNDSSRTLCKLFVSPTSKDGWGPNQMTKGVEPGKNFTLRNIPPGSYNWRVEDCKGNYIERLDKNLEEGNEYTWTIHD